MKLTKKLYEKAKIEILLFRLADLMAVSGEVPDEGNLDDSWI